LTPSGTGIVSIVSDLEVGYGTGTAAITSAGAHDLDLVTNGGTNSGLIRIVDGVNGNIELTPNGTGKINLDGLLWPNADGTNGQVLTTNGTGTLSFSTISSGITDVVNDTTPQLGGNLDVNGNSIVSVSNGNIAITPNGTGQINLGLTSLTSYKETIYAGGSQASAYTPNYSNGTVHKVTLTGNVTFAAPTNMPAGSSLTLILTQDGTGSRTGTWNASYKWMGGTPTLSTTAAAIDVVNVFYDGTNYIAGISKEQASGGGGIANVVEDTTPQLGGDLDVQANSIITSTVDGNIEIVPNGAGIVSLVSDLEVGYGNAAAAITSKGAYSLDIVTNGGTNSGVITINSGINGNIELTPNGTGKVVLDGLNYPTADGTANQVLKTDGAGNLSFTTVSAGSSVTMFSFRISGMSLITGSTYRGDITEIYDPGNVLSITSNQFSLAAGTYLLLCNGHLVGTTNSLRMYNVTDSANISTVGGFDMSASTGGTLTTAGELTTGQQAAITLAATKTVEVRMTRSGAGDVQMSVTFIKIA
jgi:hypothetical protein